MSAGAGPSTIDGSSSLPVKALLVCAEVGEGTVVGRAVARLLAELEHLGVLVTVTRSERDAVAALASERDLHVAVVDWDLTAGGAGGHALVEAVRGQSEELPLFLMADREGIDAVPVATVRRCDGFVYPLDDTADWIAGRLRDAAQRYRLALAPTMFAGLVRFSHEHGYSWHTPGHEGGAAFRKSPVGRAFFEFFGEQTFRSDLSISVGELGPLLDHSGPIGAAERDAAYIQSLYRLRFLANNVAALRFGNSLVVLTRIDNREVARQVVGKLENLGAR